MCKCEISASLIIMPSKYLSKDRGKKSQEKRLGPLIEIFLRVDTSKFNWVGKKNQMEERQSI